MSRHGSPVGYTIGDVNPSSPEVIQENPAKSYEYPLPAPLRMCEGVHGLGDEDAASRQFGGGHERAVVTDNLPISFRDPGDEPLWRPQILPIPELDVFAWIDCRVNERCEPGNLLLVSRFVWPRLPVARVIPPWFFSICPRRHLPFRNGLSIHVYCMNPLPAIGFESGSAWSMPRCQAAAHRHGIPRPAESWRHRAF